MALFLSLATFKIRFPLQLVSYSQLDLLVLVRYVFEKEVKEELLLCSPLDTTTTAGDVMNKISSYFLNEGLE